jgi:hypothetical protein
MRSLHWRLICLVCLIYSCKKSSESAGASFPIIDSLSGRYLVYPLPHDGLINELSVPGIYPVYFVYDKDHRLVKRIGGTITDILSVYYNTIYDTIIYKTSEDILLTTLSNSSNLHLPPMNREVFFSGNRMTEKIFYDVDPSNPPAQNDTIWYFYDGNNRLSRWRWHTTASDYQESIVTYDNNGNMTQVLSYWLNQRTLVQVPVQVDTERFTGYDHAANPLQGLCLWEDLLYRSLSRNNFSNYRYIGPFLNSGGLDWQLNYLPNGQVDFSH